MNYFTFRALKETLSQMQETDLCVPARARRDSGERVSASAPQGRRGALSTRARDRHAFARLTDDDAVSSSTRRIAQITG